MTDPKQALRDALSAIGRQFAAEVTSQPLEPGRDYLPPSGKVVGVEEFTALLQASADMWLTAQFTGEFRLEREPGCPLGPDQP